MVAEDQLDTNVTVGVRAIDNQDQESMKDQPHIEEHSKGTTPLHSDDDMEKQVLPFNADTDEPPDGGVVAITQVALGFFTIFDSWGVVLAFGAYQDYYEKEMMKGTSPSVISWIGSIQAFMVMLIPMFTGRLLDAGYLRPVLIAGTFFVVFGLMMCSLSTEFYQVLLSQGVCTGIGCACLFSAGITTVAPYFKKRRSTALGVVATGSSVGGVLYPIMTEQLIPKVGFAWTTRIIGFLVLGTCIPVCILMKSRLPPRKSGPLIDYASFKDYPYMLFTFGTVFNFIGQYVPIFFIQTFARTNDVQPNVAKYILSILNTASVLGRLLPNIFADKIGPLNVIIPCVMSAGVLCYGWIGISTTAGVIVFALLYGFMSGVMVSMPAPIISSMTHDMTKIGSRLGMNFAFCSAGVLIGAPVAGAIINSMDGKYLGAQIFGGTAIMVGVALMVFSRLLFTKGELFTKA